MDSDSYYHENGDPIKCYQCDCIELKRRKEIYMDGHQLLEYEMYCTKCGTAVGYWAYGHWMGHSH